MNFSEIKKTAKKRPMTRREFTWPHRRNTWTQLHGNETYV